MVRTFLLLHGARHGAWCWQFAIDELERRGHAGIAMDLPVGEPDAGAVRYAETAADAAAGVEGAVTVVGHSLAGLVIPLLPALRPVDELVFVCSPLPVPGESLAEQQLAEPEIFIRENLQPESMEAGGTVERTPESAIAAFYHDCPDELARWAVSQLRPQSTQPLTEPSPVESWPPELPCRYILGRDDRILNPAWSRRAVPLRLGVEPIELDGGHSPFLARPAAFVDALLGPGA
jgi:pimeloyl-ACP methyl ester carboxylesterase